MSGRRGARARRAGSAATLALVLTAGAAFAGESLLDVPVGAAMPLPLVAGCGQPDPAALTVDGGIMVFTLRPGDVGGCQSDGDGARPHDAAPHMERIEVRSPELPRGATYRFTLAVRVSGAHQSAPDTSVLQLHQWHGRRCLCSPPLMLGFDAKGNLVARLLMGQGRHRRMVLPGLTRADLADRWVPLAVEIENVAGWAALVLAVDGRPVLSGRVLIEPEGTLFFKTGLYRRGRADGKLPVDRIAVRDVQVQSVAAAR